MRGGLHDGPGRATSLCAYVWLRMSCVTSLEDEATLWRNALSFGVLEMITGMQIPEKVLLSSRPDGSYVLTSAKVSRFLSHWLFGRPVKVHPIGRRQWIARADDTINWALRAIEERFLEVPLWFPGGPSPAQCPRLFYPHQPGDTTILSLTTLMHLLRHLTLRLLMVEEMRISPPGVLPTPERLPCQDAGMKVEGAVCARYLRMIKDSGWCTPTVRRMEEPMYLAYASTLTPLLQRHAEDHTACDDADECRSSHLRLNTATYRTQHAPRCSDSSCTFLSPTGRVQELLRSGQIPVVALDGSALTVHRAIDRPYIAISHVWADGLGSTTEDGLPTCQIARISAVASRLVRGGAFWLDSLCIPGKDKELRKCAIRLMAQTYQGAEKVVVFDAGLRQLSVSSTPVQEVVVRIELSSWMRRIWTLQEGLLARELYFEFSDGIFALQSAIDGFDQSHDWIQSRLGLFHHNPFLRLYCPQYVFTLMILHRRDHHRMSPSLALIASLLGNRTTSKPEDETIAVAGLLGVDVTQLLATEDADARMKIFLLELARKSGLPALIIFSDGPRLSYRGFRWAPRHLASLRALVADSEFGMAQLTPEGLTTEQKFLLIRFRSGLEVSRSDALPTEHLGGIIMHDPDTSTAYSCILYSPNAAAGKAQLVNGLVVERVPPDLESPAQRSRTRYRAIAVRSVSSESDPSRTTGGSKDGSVPCEHLFTVKLERVPVESDDDLVSQVARVLRPPVAVEASFVFTRVTII